MKQRMKQVVIMMAFLVAACALFAQQHPIPETVVVFGADCSLAKIVTTNDYNVETIVKNDFPRLNREMAVICEQFKEKFWARELVIDTTIVSKRNAERSPYTLLTDVKYQFSNGDGQARDVVTHYNTEAYAGRNGVGLLFVMEKIDERKDRESFYIVMFDLQSKKIIHCDKVETGLSSIKNAVGSGWFSWKTGIFRTIAAMDDVYEFWKLYPEEEKINVTQYKEKIQLNDSIHPIRVIPDTARGMKKAKLLMLDVSITSFTEQMKWDYEDLLIEKYGASSYYLVSNTSFIPQFNISFDYGITKRQTVGGSLGYDKCSITWGKVYNMHTDTWKRYQAAVRWNYYFVRVPIYNLYGGVQFTYNAYSKQLGSDPDQFSKQIVPYNIGMQLHLGMAFFIKQKTGINVRGGIGVLSSYVTIGVSRRF